METVIVVNLTGVEGKFLIRPLRTLTFDGRASLLTLKKKP
jgi:hypothetical protein